MKSVKVQIISFSIFKKNYNTKIIVNIYIKTIIFFNKICNEKNCMR